ncbi:MAG TPA: Kazal-type serine protease inhibitor [Kofleriaceae bacterium]|nr:Kazal-type serine protease inhibitor [Kofleriaceae bacterium]
MKRLWLMLALAACGTDPHHGQGNVETGGACVASDDCASAYCEWPDGHACTDGTAGVCTAVLAGQNCPDIVDPVCGCNGKTYPNACIAHTAGESVAYRGSCRS